MMFLICALFGEGHVYWKGGVSKRVPITNFSKFKARCLLGGGIERDPALFMGLPYFRFLKSAKFAEQGSLSNEVLNFKIKIT